MEKVDKETKEIIDTESKIEDFVKSEAWQIIREKLHEQIMDLQSIKSINLGGDPTSIAIDLKARNYAVDTLFNLIQDIEGTAIKSEDQRVMFSRKSLIVEK